MIGEARIMMSIFGAALCLLVFRIGREFFGILGGLIAETVAAFDPNFLAHSPLVDSDVPAAFFFTATVWTCWRLFQEITPARFVITALSLSGLFLTKFSAPLVLPILGSISILQFFSSTRRSEMKKKARSRRKQLPPELSTSRQSRRLSAISRAMPHEISRT
jgi:4-amino-4-deoxy-L-arabinose transferase-like glycosyltransferase